MKPLQIFGVLLLLGTILSPLSAEVGLGGEIGLMHTVSISDLSQPEEWSLRSGGSGELSVFSVGGRNVKGEMKLQFSTDNTSGPSSLTLGKLEIKVRFPSFRLTAGKTRLRWGDGQFFNAGDLLYGSTDAQQVDLSQAELRTQTALLTAVQVPYGNFSFIEAVVLPEDTKLYNTDAGARVYTTVGSLKAEGGYLFSDRAAEEAEHAHHMYASFQGNIGPDWYAAVSSALPGPYSTNTALDMLTEKLNLTFGLFHLQQLTRVQSLSLRLEALVRPWQKWTKEASQSDYGLIIYPEVSYTHSDSLSFSLRSLFSPIDLSAQLSAGVNWNVMQGFSLLGYLSAQAGERTDVYSWQPGGINMTVGGSYTF